MKQLTRTNNKIKFNKKSNNKCSLVFLFALMTFSHAAFSADERENVTEQIALQSYSTGQSVTDLNNTTQQQVLTTLKQNQLLGNSDQLQKKSANLSRDEIINEKIKKAQDQTSTTLNTLIKSNNTTKVSNLKSLSRSHDSYFTVYEGHSTLIEDYDADGYYQTFSVTFDADLVSYNPYDEAIIYAELYLSENGGPWEHYFTTKDFVIMGENTEDKFEVFSTLGDGFNPNHYDVLIDIYEVNSPYIMASYSSDDSNSLYALPLENHYDDTPYSGYSEEAYIQGGSYSIPLLLLLLMILLVRQFRQKEEQY